MKTVKKNVYYCEHCKKHGLSASSMSRHEASCTANPNRRCRMCQITGEAQQPTEVLKACVAQLALDWGDWDVDMVYLDKRHKDSVTAMESLRSASNNCPACIAAALRQSGIPWSVVGFDLQKECASFWDDVNAAKEENSHHG